MVQGRPVRRAKRKTSGTGGGVRGNGILLASPFRFGFRVATFETTLSALLGTHLGSDISTVEETGGFGLAPEF